MCECVCVWSVLCVGESVFSVCVCVCGVCVGGGE